MQNKIFAVYDSKGVVFLHFHIEKERGEATRSFGAAISSGKSDMSKHAEDFALFELGTIDIETGIVTPHTSPLCLTTAVNASREYREYYANLELEKLQPAA